MMQERSFGVIPLQKKGKNKEWHALLINHRQGGFWAFPKGHAEEGETPEEAARRELFEETGLTIVQILSAEIFKESYSFFRGKSFIHKEVQYYLAEVEGKLKLQAGEIFDARWVPLKEAEQQITFTESKNLCRKAFDIINRA